MANPFTTRATEFVKSNEAFLSLIAPDPITFYVVPHASDDGLFRRLLSIQGQPGSGKTTIARLFEFSTIASLLRGSKNETYSELVSPLQKCGALAGGVARTVACRIPLESDYRELWQLPYSERIKMELLQRLIQARAVLAWFSQLTKSGISVSDVSIDAKDESHASLSFVGGSKGIDVLDRARHVEAAIYQTVGALLPPPESRIETTIVEPYRPFDIIDRFRLADGSPALGTCSATLIPVVILDDVHFLHAPQLNSLKSWLVRRELTIGRWILSRLDVLKPQDLFDSLRSPETSVDMPGITAGRDIVTIHLQNTSKREREEGRRNFRGMARQMSRKYLGQMRIFSENSITTLEEVLPSRVEALARSHCEDLADSVKAAARKFRVNEARLKEFQAMTDEFLQCRSENTEDLRWAIIRILIHRYAKRTPQISLFPDESDAEPSKPLRVDLSVHDGARIHLLHEFGRPYFVGFDALSDAASENAEAFLRLASHVVEAAENLLIKQRSPVIGAREQHKLLTARACSIVDTWSFPEHRRVRILASWIADRCKGRSLEPNAPLGHGANAYGILQEDFNRIGTEHPDLANVLKFGVAYNAFALVPSYECKGKVWCLVELGGVFLVRSGLPFKRGGFVEGTAEELNRSLAI